MFRILLILQVALLLRVSGFSQAMIHEKEVPAEILEDFQYRFHTAEQVVWLKQSQQYYGARFKEGKRAGEVVYDAQGEWQQTEQEISYREMPDSARSYCRQTYPDYKAKAALKVSTRRYGILYELVITGGKQVMMTFDMHGKLLEEKEAEIVVEEEPTQKEGKGLKGKLNKLVRRKGAK